MTPAATRRGITPPTSPADALARLRRLRGTYGWAFAHPTAAAAVFLAASGLGPRLVRRFPALARPAHAWFAARQPWILRLLAPSIYEARFMQVTSEDDRYAFMRRCLQGSGVEWASHYDERPVEERLGRDLPACSGADAYPLYPFLASLETRGRALFVQLGCSSGTEAFWLARERPGHEVVGTDVTEAIVARAASKYARPNLRYLVADALTLAAGVRRLVEGGRAGMVVLFSSGSCQYVLPGHLAQLFAGFASLPLPSVVAVLEPGSTAAGDPFELGASRHRGGFSWTHNYGAVLRAAGFGVDVARVIHPYPPDSPQHGTVHLFTVGSRAAATGAPQPALTETAPR